MADGSAELALVGRDTELDRLRGCVAVAAEGDPQAVVIEGDAGIGKTCLLDALTAAATAAGFAVARGTGDELAQHRPFGAAADALGITPDSPDAARRSIAKLLRSATLAAAGGLGGRAHVVNEELVALVEDDCRKRPVLVAIDDLQWVDHGTLLLVRALGLGLQGLPFIIASALRPFPRSPELATVLSELAASGSHWLRLDGIDTDAAATLAGAAAGADLTPAQRDRLAAARGNPLFVIELARAAASGALDASVPPQLSDLLLRRVRSLGDEVVDVLRFAAALGSRFDSAELAVAAGRSVVDLVKPLRVAIDAGVLADADGDFAFRHDLVREAIYDDVPVAIRRSLHGEIGRALAASGAPAGRVAPQLALGALPGDEDAVRWLLDAATEAKRTSPEIAADLLARALELHPAGDDERERIQVERLWALTSAGRGTDCEREAHAFLEGRPNRRHAANAHACIGLVQQRRGDLAAAVDHFAAATELGGEESLPYRADEATARALLGDGDRARAIAIETIAAADAAGHQGARCEAQCALTLVAHAAGNIEEAVSSGRAAVDTHDRGLAAMQWNPSPRLYLGLAQLDGASLDEALDMLLEGRSQADREGTVVQLPWFQWALAVRHYLAGDWDDAEIEVTTGLRVAAEVDTSIIVPSLEALSARLALHRGGPEVAAQVREVADRAVGAQWLEWLQVAALEGTADSDAVRDAAAAAWERGRSRRWMLVWALLGPDAVRAHVVAGDLTGATRVAEELTTGALAMGAVGTAVANWCTALVARDGPGLLQASGLLADVGRRPLAARASEDAGRAFAEQGAAQEAAQALGDAASAFELLGASDDARRARAEVSTTGRPRRRSSPRERPTFGWASLTPSELAVVERVAAGLANKAVAEELFLSRYTVETHLKRVFTKLGIRSRTELTVLALSRDT